MDTRKIKGTITNYIFFVASMLLFAKVPASQVPLLSEINSGYAYIEVIQKVYCKKNPSHNCNLDPVQCENSVKKLWRDMFKQEASEANIKESCDRVSTRVEIPGVYRLLSNLFNEVRDVAPQVGLAKLDNVHLGSLPIKAVNARVLPPKPDLGNFLVFNVRFFEFASELAKVAALSIPMEDDEGLIKIDGSPEALEEKLAQNMEIRFLFINRLMHFLNVESMKPAPPPAEIQPILVRYQEGIELFAMAHEYAHIALNHVGQTASLENESASMGGLAIAGNSGDWTQEFEADYYASEILKLILAKRLSGKDLHMAEYMLTYTPQFYFLTRRIITEANALFFGDVAAGVDGLNEEHLLDISLSCIRNKPCSFMEVLKVQPVIPKGHPSYEVRERLSRTLLERPIAGRSETEEALAELASQMYRNISFLWSDTRARLEAPEAEPLIKLVRDGREKMLKEQK